MSNNISELTDADLSLWIAEKIEPKASLPKAFDPPVLDSWHLSPLKAWQIVVLYYGGDEPTWAVRDMVNDPAMTVMLLDKRFFHSMRKHARGWIFQDDEGHDRKHVGNLTVMSLGRAVAEAYALANGWKP